MKRIFTLILMTSIIISCGCSKQADSEATATTSSEVITTTETTKTTVIENPDFRNIKWGMTKEEVMDSENMSPDYESYDGLTYSDIQVANLDATLMYLFDTENKVYTAGYSFSEKHSNENLYINDFENVVDALSDKYGEPKMNEKMWYNDLYKDDPDDYGFAVSLGDLSYVALWETTTTQIALYLTGDNYSINHNLYYISKNYSPVTDSDTGL